MKNGWLVLVLGVVACGGNKSGGNDSGSSPKGGASSAAGGGVDCAAQCEMSHKCEAELLGATDKMLTEMGTPEEAKKQALDAAKGAMQSDKCVAMCTEGAKAVPELAKKSAECAAKASCEEMAACSIALSKEALKAAGH